MQTLLAISLSMSIDEEGKGIYKNKQKEKMLIIGMEWLEKMREKTSLIQIKQIYSK